MRRKNTLVVVGVGVAAAALVWASGIAPQAYSIIQNNKVSVAPGRPILNFPNGGCVDDPGNNSTDCTVAAGGTGVGLTSYSQSFTSQTSVTLTDNAGTLLKQVQCYDNASPANVIIPQNIALTSTASTTVTFSSAQSGSCTVIWSAAAGALFRQTASVTVANTVVETTLTSTGVGSLTLPANFFNQGTTLKLRVFGTHSAVSAPSVEIRVKIGAVTVLDTGVVTTGNSTNALLDVESWITCRTTGATGTVFAQGWYKELTAAGLLTTFPMVNTTTSTIDTTASNAVNITWQWGTASVSDTVTATNLVLESTGP